MSDTYPKIMLSRSDGVIDLAWGHPSERLHPLVTLKPAVDELFASGEIAALQYSGYQGYGPLIESLAGFLSDQPCYTDPVKPEELYIGYGASHGLDVACTLFTRAGDTVWVEEPSYYLVRQVLIDHRLNIVGVPTDGQGMDVRAAGAMLERGEIPRPTLVYVIPTYHNPMGTVMPADRRAALAELAERHDFMVASDEAYHLLSYGTTPPAPLAAYDRSPDGRVLSLGSFSKVLAPGIKLGWVQAKPKLVDRYTYSGANFSGGNNNFAAAIVDVAIRSGLLGEHLDSLRGIYRDRVAVMASGLASALPGATFQVPGGGYYFWVELPDGVDAAELEHHALEAGVTLRPGPAFSGEGLFTNCVRLCFALSESDEIAEGLRRLGKAYAGLTGVSSA
jgi:2-aminoadipate transaminase